MNGRRMLKKIEKVWKNRISNRKMSMQLTDYPMRSEPRKSRIAIPPIYIFQCFSDSILNVAVEAAMVQCLDRASFWPGACKEAHPEQHHR